MLLFWSHLTLKAGCCTWRGTCCQDPPCAALPARCPAPQGSHCSRWSCTRKRKAAHGPKCDQCIINYTSVCFLSSTNHLCVNVVLDCSSGRHWVGPACPGPYWSQGEGLSAVCSRERAARALGHGDVTTVQVKFLSYPLNWPHVAFFILHISLTVFLSWLSSVFCLSSKGWNALNKSILMLLEGLLAGLQ